VSSGGEVRLFMVRAFWVGSREDWLEPSAMEERRGDCWGGDDLGLW
jgi:hypothetical protein